MRSKTKKKNKNKRKVKAQGNKFSIWLEKHWLVEALLGYIFFIMVAIGVGFLTYYSWFGSLREEGFNTLKGFSEVFLYLNGLLFLLHYFIGIELEDGEGFLPPLWNLNPRYVWFPIATYLIFFSFQH